jgi:formylglycine-generating enzyme required for sulfatase activity
MKRITLTLSIVALLAASLHAAAPVVSNLSASQRAGTKLVDIVYDVAADTSSVDISLEVSSDGGSSFTVPATSLSGAIGAGVAVGTDRTITWDAGADWNQQSSSTMRFKVTADDVEAPAVPDGFALIPGGSFQMGDALDGLSNAPVVTVAVSAFYMGKYEVTKAEWDEVRTWGLSNGYTDLPSGGGKAADHPVHSINWYAMVKWCNARSEQAGRTPCYTVSGSTYRTGSSDAVVCDWTATGYRLPTEAEWEKAARGGATGQRFPWGATISHANANYEESTSYSYDVGDGSGTHPDYDSGGTPYTSAVGSFAANGYGLYDMAGNVSERCWDWFSSSSYSDGAADPRGAASGSNRVLRGGSWPNSAYYCRVANRFNHNPSNSYSVIGFRVALRSVPQ